jgi:hypothetical protein
MHQSKFGTTYDPDWQRECGSESNGVCGTLQQQAREMRQSKFGTIYDLGWQSGYGNESRYLNSFKRLFYEGKLICVKVNRFYLQFYFQFFVMCTFCVFI